MWWFHCGLLITPSVRRIIYVSRIYTWSIKYRSVCISIHVTHEIKYGGTYLIIFPPFLCTLYSNENTNYYDKKAKIIGHHFTYSFIKHLCVIIYHYLLFVFNHDFILMSWHKALYQNRCIAISVFSLIAIMQTSLMRYLCTCRIMKRIELDGTEEYNQLTNH